MVCAPVRHRAARVFIPKPKRPMAALFHVIRHRRGPEPEIPIQSRRHRRGRKRPCAQPRRQPHLGLLQFPNAPIPHEFTGQPKARRTPLLRARLQHDSALLHSPDEPAPFVNGKRERLLAINIFARPRRAEIHQRVPVVGRGVNDDVHIVAFEDLAKIAVDLRHLALDREFRRRLRRVLCIDVTHRDDVAVIGRISGIAFTLTAAADECDARPAIGRIWFGLPRLCRRELPLDKP